MLFLVRALPAAVLLLTAAAAASAQGRWVQNVQVIVPIEENGAASALLDTVASFLEHGTLRVQRTADGDSRSYQDLDAELSREGFHVTSASHVFISYRYEASQMGLSTEIRDLAFIYRSPMMDEADIPILYLPAGDPFVRYVLHARGTPLPTNEAVFTPFAEQIMFHHLADGRVVRVGNRVIRDPAEAEREKQRIFATIRRLLY